MGCEFRILFSRAAALAPTLKDTLQYAISKTKFKRLCKPAKKVYLYRLVSTLLTSLRESSLRISDNRPEAYINLFSISQIMVVKIKDIMMKKMQIIMSTYPVRLQS